MILLVVVGLALAAILQANRATRAESDAREKLWRSYLDQARSTRAGAQAGHRFEGLEALAKAAAMHPSPELRDEAIACLALADLRLLAPRFAVTNVKASIDARFERYATGDAQG